MTFSIWLDMIIIFSFIALYVVLCILSTRPFRYDLNQILYDYTMKVKNRFKGLDLINRVPEELWTEVYNIVQEVMIKIIPKKTKCKKAKWLSEESDVKVKSLSHIQLLMTLGTIAYQASLSMGFSRQEYWSELSFPSPEDLTNSGIESSSPAMKADALTSEPPGKPRVVWGDLTNSWEKKRSERQRKKGKLYPVWMQNSKK